MLASNERPAVQGKLSLKHLRVASFVTSDTKSGIALGVSDDQAMSSLCTCSTCDVTASGSGTCGSACGSTVCTCFEFGGHLS